MRKVGFIAPPRSGYCFSIYHDETQFRLYKEWYESTPHGVKHHKQTQATFNDLVSCINTIQERI